MGAVRRLLPLLSEPSAAVSRLRPVPGGDPLSKLTNLSLVLRANPPRAAVSALRLLMDHPIRSCDVGNCQKADVRHPAVKRQLRSDRDPTRVELKVRLRCVDGESRRAAYGQVRHATGQSARGVGISTPEITCKLGPSGLVLSASSGTAFGHVLKARSSELWRREGLKERTALISRVRQSTALPENRGITGRFSPNDAGGETCVRVRWRRERDSNPRYGCPYTHFPGVRLQPLGHPSVGAYGAVA
jgi:hypothetical protein